MRRVARIVGVVFVAAHGFGADLVQCVKPVHPTPNVPQITLVQPPKPLSKDDLAKELRVRSLFDTHLCIG
jgi:hypothetical protein